MVTDYDSWHPHHGEVDIQSILRVLNGNSENAKRFVARLARDFPREHEVCSVGSDAALEYAIMTAPDKRDPELVKKLDAVAGKVLNRRMSAPASIAYDDFTKVDIRVGTVVEVEPYPEARKPAFKLKIDFGPEIGIKKSAAQITVHYTPATLMGKQVAAVVNFPPRQIGKFMSEVLTLGFPDAEGAVVLIGPTLPIPNGGRLF